MGIQKRSCTSALTTGSWHFHGLQYVVIFCAVQPYSQQFQTACRLEDCLEDYTRLEILKDCICRKCSVMATHKRLLQEFQTLKEAIDPSSAISFTPGASIFAESESLISGTSMPSASPSKSKPSNSKKKRFKEVKKMEQQVRTALTEGRIEDEKLLEGVRLERIVSPASTKQAMIARVSFLQHIRTLP